MSTLTIVEQVKIGKRVDYQRKLVLIHFMDKARKLITHITKEMNLAKKEKRAPVKSIEGVSYDTDSEKRLLLELHAIESIENEEA